MKASLQLQPMYCSRDYNYSSRFNQQYEKPTQHKKHFCFFKTESGTHAIVQLENYLSIAQDSVKYLITPGYRQRSSI